MKEFAVIGLGNFGATVARELSRLKCRVTAIDADKSRVQSIQDDIHLAILANAGEREFLANMEVEKFDGFIVSTGEDTHASILITLYLKELGARQIIVKARSADHAKILLKVGATQAIIPEKQMAHKIAHSLSESNLIDYLPLTGDYYVGELVPPTKFIGKSLKDLNLRSKYHVQVIAVKHRETGVFHFAPGGDYIIASTDILVTLGRESDLQQLKT